MTETLSPEQREALEALLKTPEKPKVEEKKEPKPPKVKGIRDAEYEIIEIKDGFNLHKTVKEPFSEHSYEKERFLIKRSLSDKFYSRIRFLVVFKSPAKEGDKPIPVALSDPVEINSRLLYTVKTSRTLKNALVSLFRKPFSFGGFGGKRMLFIGVIIVVGAIAYLVYTGQFNLGSIIKV